MPDASQQLTTVAPAPVSSYYSPFVKETAAIATPVIAVVFTATITIALFVLNRRNSASSERRSNERTQAVQKEMRAKEKRDRTLNALFEISEHAQLVFYVCERATVKKRDYLQQVKYDVARRNSAGSDPSLIADGKAKMQALLEQLESLNAERIGIIAKLNVDAMRIASELGEGPSSPLVAAIKALIVATERAGPDDVLLSTKNELDAVFAAVRAIAKPLME